MSIQLLLTLLVVCATVESWKYCSLFSNLNFKINLEVRKQNKLNLIKIILNLGFERLSGGGASQAGAAFLFQRLRRTNEKFIFKFYPFENNENVSIFKMVINFKSTQ